MDIEVAAGIHAGHLLVRFDGREYLRHGRQWYDAKSRIGLPAVEADRMEALLRSKPALLEEAHAVEARECLARHRARLTSLGIAHRGAGPACGWIHRCTHCWACKHPLDSEVDLQCYACGWILCRCGGCGCGFYDWGYRH
jgi:hypothetical protein